MKNNLMKQYKNLLVVGLICIFSASNAFAQVASLPAVSSGVQDATTMIGVVAGATGEVKLDRANEVGQVVSSGSQIYLGDKISTDSQGSLQILLLDQTTFTIGPNSAIVVDQFVYDPSTDAGKVAVSVVEGTFRFITGKIGTKNPENMKVDLPNGTIAIRGTMVMGRVAGRNSLFILAGPGDKNNTGNKQGEIIVSGSNGSQGRQVRIAKTGFGTEIEGDNPPKLPFQPSAQVLNSMNQELQPEQDKKEPSQNSNQPNNQRDPNNQKSGPAQNQGKKIERRPGAEVDPKSASEQAGQEKIDVRIHADGANTLSGLGDDFRKESEKTAQEIANEFRETFDGVTRVGDLTKVSVATGRYTASGLNLFRKSDSMTKGSFNVDVFVDFNNRTMGGNTSTIDGSVTGFAGGGSFSLSLDKKSFSNDAAEIARVVYAKSISVGTCSTNCTARVDINLINAGGEVARGAVVNMELLDSVSNLEDVRGTAVAPRS